MNIFGWRNRAKTAPQPAVDPAPLGSAFPDSPIIRTAPALPQSPQPAAVAAEPAPPEITMSFLSAIGKSFKAVFTWLGSTTGQAVIAAGESVITTIDPQLTGIVNLANSWIVKIITTETLAAAAGEQTGSGAQKASAVLTAMQPEIAKYFPTATAAEIANANTAIVAFLNAFTTTTTAA